MKWCVQFPEETILIVRPCLVAICMGNRPAAKLLHVLLYLYSIRQENKTDAENINEAKRLRGEVADQDTSYSIHRKQSQLIELMCGEITEKTLHDVAVPWLQLLGYLDLEEDLKSNRYILHIDRVTNALNQYDPNKQLTNELEKFLIENFQLEKFLITSDEIKEAIANKKNFSLQLEKVLIRNRKISNCQRGRKPNGQAGSKGKSKKDRLNRDSNREKESNKESSSPDQDDSFLLSSTQSSLVSSSADKQEDTPINTRQDDTPSPIATTTTQKNVESLTTRKTSSEQYSCAIPQKPLLSSEEQRIQGYWCALGFMERPSAQKHWNTLAKHIKSFEEMKSLYSYAKEHIRNDTTIKDKRVNPGNLANAGILDGWKQEQEPQQEKPSKPREKVTAGNRHLQSFSSMSLR